MQCHAGRRRPRTHGSVRLHPLRARESGSGTTDTRGGRAASSSSAPPPAPIETLQMHGSHPHPMQCMHASPRHRRHTCKSMTKLVRTYSTVSDSQYSTVVTGKEEDGRTDNAACPRQGQGTSLLVHVFKVGLGRTTCCYWMLAC